VAAKGDRRRFIAEAVHHYVTATGRMKLRARIAEGATRRAARDLQLARDWFVLDEETWQSQSR
jgi:CopG family transcriptional regulator/antitoxin EndoAI